MSYLHILNGKHFTCTGPTSQDAETPSYYGLHPFCYIVNAGGGTRSDSEFRRPEMWAQYV
jgi:hypothetical protein